MKKSDKPAPKLFRKPMISAAVILVLDLLTLAAAILLHSVRGKFSVTYYVTGNAIQKENPLAAFDIAAAVMICLVAAFTGIMLAAIFNRRPYSGLPAKIAASLLLLAASAGAIVFSALVVNPRANDDARVFGYSDDRNTIYLEEQSYKNGEIVMSVYSDNGDGTAKLLASTELHERAESGERYTIAWVSDSVFTIGFYDYNDYHSMKIEMDTNRPAE